MLRAKVVREVLGCARPRRSNVGSSSDTRKYQKPVGYLALLRPGGAQAELTDFKQAALAAALVWALMMGSNPDRSLILSHLLKMSFPPQTRQLDQIIRCQREREADQYDDKPSVNRLNRQFMQGHHHRKMP